MIIYDLQNRAKALREKTQTASVTPEEVGGLFADCLEFIANIEQAAGSLRIRKTYKTKKEMEDDTKPTDWGGNPLKSGHIVAIHVGGEGPNNGEIYVYQAPGWKLIGNFNKVTLGEGSGQAYSGDAGKRLADALEQEKKDRATGDTQVESNIRDDLGQPSGFAPLDEHVKVPTAHMPEDVYEVLMFDGFEKVTNYEFNSAAAPVEIYFDSTKQRFFPKKNGKFFENWPNRDRYLDPNTGAPYTKKIYVNATENIPYRWNGTRMKPLSAAGKDGRLLRFVHGTGDTSRALVANAMHIWGVVPELRLSLAENPEPEFVAEYCFQFTSPADRGTSLMLPKGLKWGGQDDDDEDYKPQIRPGITYQAIISENVIIIMGAK